MDTRIKDRLFVLPDLDWLNPRTSPLGMLHDLDPELLSGGVPFRSKAMNV